MKDTATTDLWYRLTQVPDLTLKKYASLEGKGVDGVIEQHTAFLRQLNRKGIVSGLSYHLFYLYLAPDDPAKDMPGRRLQIYLMIRGTQEALENVPALIGASPLSTFFHLEPHAADSDPERSTLKLLRRLRDTDRRLTDDIAAADDAARAEALRTRRNAVREEAEAELDKLGDAINADLDGAVHSIGDASASIRDILRIRGIDTPTFQSCAFLSKSELLLPPPIDAGANADPYYTLSEWEMNDDGRLFHMCKMMEALNRTALYRVDLYPVERGAALRKQLRKPMDTLRRRQDDRDRGTRRDYDGKDVLNQYEKTLEKFDSSPHFIANIMVFADKREDAVSILDAAGAESLTEGKYSISTFASGARRFTPLSFLDDPDFEGLDNIREKMTVRRGNPGLVVCRQDTAALTLSYTPTLFSLEELAPFFRLPALYDGEVIQIPKETAPTAIDKDGSLFLGRDSNGYDVYYPLALLPKHAFVAGVPGSGKTNTMHHITSSLWKDHHIPFLVLEPAKKEYRALLNDPDMRDVYLFSPNADMSFPLHINPFEMPRGTLVAEHIRMLCSVFEGSFTLEPPTPFLLDQAIESVYRDLGWEPEHRYTGEETRVVNGKNVRRPLPTMSMLYERLEKELETTTYAAEVRGNIESAIKVRIGSLIRREMGDIFDVPRSTFEPERWLEVPAVIELEALGTDQANFLTLLLCSLIRETLKAHPRYDKGDVRHVIFIEEAHNLIGPDSYPQPGQDADPKVSATAFIVKMLAEVRALKEGIVIADQLPSVMAPEVLKNTGLKIGLRITAADDRQMLGNTMAATGLQMEQMATFAVGEALIFYEGLMRPFSMRIKEWWGELDNEAEKEAMTAPKDDDELRAVLAHNAAFQEENQRSMIITCSKYYLPYREICDTARATTYARISEIGKLINKKSRMTEDVGRALNGEITMPQDTYENWLEQINRIDERLQGPEVKREHDQIMRQVTRIKDGILALERLEATRWARFDAPRSTLNDIVVTEWQMCSFAKTTYERLRIALGTSPADGMLPKGKELQEIFDRLEQSLKTYADRNGINLKMQEASYWWLNLPSESTRTSTPAKTSNTNK